MKKLMKLFSYGLLAITSIVGLSKVQQSNKSLLKLSANEQVEKYIPVNNENFTITNEDDLNAWVTGRYGTFWNHRYFNALDDFYDGFRDEEFTGRLISKEWVQTGDYVTFTLGGNPYDGEEVKNYVEIKSGDTVVTTAINSDFHDPRLSLNMIVKVVKIPEEYKGENLHLEVVDGKTGGDFGGVTFGALKVNQSLTDVTRTIATHKVSLARVDTVPTDYEEDHAERNSIGRTKTLEIYATNPDYEPFLEPLTAVDEDFEENGLTNWGYDIGYSRKDVEDDSLYFINFTNAISSETTFWGENIPFNKDGTKFYNGWSADSYEPARYRLLSAPFAVSGSGYFSVKMAGRTAELQILDSQDLSIKKVYRNPAFSDKGNAAIISSGTRHGTMTRVLIDATEYLGQEVIVALADAENGGNWGVAFFDELKTYYASVPSLKLDLISHAGENGVNFDYYMGSEETTLGKAYSFVKSYYGSLRAAGTNYSYCSLLSTDVGLLESVMIDYEALDSAVKAVVSASDDYSYGLVADDGNYLHNSVELTTIGETMAYLGAVLPQSHNGGFVRKNTTNVSLTSTLIIGVVGLTLLSLYFFTLKKKKEN